MLSVVLSVVIISCYYQMFMFRHQKRFRSGTKSDSVLAHPANMVAHPANMVAPKAKIGGRKWTYPVLAPKAYLKIPFWHQKHTLKSRSGTKSILKKPSKSRSGTKSELTSTLVCDRILTA